MFYVESKGCKGGGGIGLMRGSSEDAAVKLGGIGGDIMHSTMSIPAITDRDVCMGGQACKRWKWSIPRLVVPQEEHRKGGHLSPKMASGRLLVLQTRRKEHWALPFWREPCNTPEGSSFSVEAGAPAGRSVGVVWSTDGGESWGLRGESMELAAVFLLTASPRLQRLANRGAHVVESVLVERNDGKLLLLMHELHGGLHQAISGDMGRTWGLGAAEPGLTGGVSSGLQSLDSPGGYTRTLLDVAVSGDDGSSWRRIARLESHQVAGLQSHRASVLEVGAALYVLYTSELAQVFGAMTPISWMHAPYLTGGYRTCWLQESSVDANTQLGVRIAQVKLNVRLPALENDECTYRVGDECMV
eukprot:gene4861-5936_t